MLLQFSLLLIRGSNSFQAASAGPRSYHRAIANKLQTMATSTEVMSPPVA